MDSRNPRFLIVEDCADDEKLIRRALQRMGRDMDVQAVHDGEEAIEYLCANGSDARMPDLVFLDWKLPKVMGEEVLRTIRSSSRCAEVVVVAFSSSDCPSDEEECNVLGGNAYIVKPIDYEQFLDAVQNIVKRYGPGFTRWRSEARTSSRGGDSCMDSPPAS